MSHWRKRIANSLHRWIDHIAPDARLAELAERNAEQGRELNRMSDEAALINKAVQARITGDCEKHFDIPPGKVLLMSANACTLCLTEELADARRALQASVPVVLEDPAPER